MRTGRALALHGTAHLAVPAVLSLGTLALVARTRSDAAVAATALVGIAGLLLAAPDPVRAGRARAAAVTAAGTAAFVAARAFGPAPALRATAMALAASVIAAVAEEAFFRGAMQGRLRAAGPTAAVLVPAVAFALVHVRLYEPAVLPLDLAAGVVFGWQRYATGSWGAPAITHVVANLVQFV